MHVESIELNNVAISSTKPKNVTQTEASAIVTYVEIGTQVDNIQTISSVSCNSNAVKKQTVLTQYNIVDFSSNANVHVIKAGNKLLRALQKDDNFSTFALLLEEHEQMTKFVKLVSALGTQKMKMSNMSWKAALDIGSLYMCTTTSKMTYDKEWLECHVPHVWWQSYEHMRKSLFFSCNFF